MQPQSLQTRIAISMWFLAVMGILISSILTGSLLIRNHQASVRRQLETSAAGLLAMEISDFSELEDFDQLNLFIEDALEMENIETIVRIFDHQGKILFTTLESSSEFLPDISSKPDKPTFRTLEGTDRKYESLVVPYEASGKKKYFLEVISPLPHYLQIFKNLWWQSLLFMIGLAGLSFLMARNLTKRLLQPVVGIAAHLEKMDPTHVETWKNLEMGPQGLYLTSIVSGINSLTEKTKSAVSQLKKMSRYVAHELRTPLTILQGEAETALERGSTQKSDYEAVLKSSLEEIRRMSDIVTTVLQVGEWERAAALFHPVSFDIISWIDEHLPRWGKTLGWDIHFDHKGNSNAFVSADPKLFYHLVDNLLRNIRTHTPFGTPCSFSISVSEKVTLRLIDEGPGLSEELMKSLQRQEDGFELSGVGLNLCQKIAAINQLKLHFENRSPKGLIVEITFPA